MRWPAKIAVLLTQTTGAVQHCGGRSALCQGIAGDKATRTGVTVTGGQTGMPDLLPPDLSPGGFAFLLATAFIAAMARGFSGFGAALIFVPLASTVVAPQVASPLLLITDAVLALGFIPDAFCRADRREVSIMALGAAIGIPLGTLILVRLDALTIRWAIVVLASAMLALLVSGWRYRGKPTAPLTFGVGGFAGVCSG